MVSTSRLIERSTVWTQAFGHIVDALQEIALGQADGRDGRISDAEGALAPFAVKVYVLVVFGLMTFVAETQFVAHAVAAVLNDMHKMVFAEQ